MPVLSALIHVFAFGIMVTGFEPSARLFLIIIAIPVLALHLCVWAASRFLGLGIAIGMAVILNALLPIAGWLFWWVNSANSALAPGTALRNAALFYVVGLATSALLIAWVHFAGGRRRRYAA